YKYASRPELADPDGLSKDDVARVIAACRKGKIRVIPQINLLGHQSWAGRTNRLLQVYPDFDETPWVKMPAKYAWRNDDKLYCKSYCPRHPKVHDVVFALVDEVCDAFEADAFHAGLDEVFYIGEDKCPRCAGRDKGELFADEVKLVRDHLQGKGRKLWIWGDRLLDGKATGLGMWEASTNGTDRAIDLIPRDVVICDWHYERAVPTAAYFAMKGLDVVSCPWKKPGTAVVQLKEMLEFREQSPAKLKPHFAGMMQTVWSGADSFLDEFYGRKPPAVRKGQKTGESESACFKALFAEIATKKTP
ncbi:MAG TPA: family 20 glycosylhydrolase, partial [Isosphaeraceae bacterium]